MKLATSFLGILFISIFGCETANFPYGHRLYLKHCANCHMEDGSGVADLYPGLIQDNYITKMNQMPCQIRFGSLDSTHLIMMLGLPELSDVEITNIINYLSIDMNKTDKEITINETKQILSSCTQEQAY